MNKLIKRSFLNALGVIVYVAGLVTTVQNSQKIFGHVNESIAPIIFLTVFVLSAGVTGGLVLGKPGLMYLDNQKSDAIKLFLYTLCWLALAVVLLLFASVLFK